MNSFSATATSARASGLSAARPCDEAESRASPTKLAGRICASRSASTYSSAVYPMSSHTTHPEACVTAAASPYCRSVLFSAAPPPSACMPRTPCLVSRTRVRVLSGVPTTAHTDAPPQNAAGAVCSGSQGRAAAQAMRATVACVDACAGPPPTRKASVPTPCENARTTRTTLLNSRGPRAMCARFSMRRALVRWCQERKQGGGRVLLWTLGLGGAAGKGVENNFSQKRRNPNGQRPNPNRPGRLGASLHQEGVSKAARPMVRDARPAAGLRRLPALQRGRATARHDVHTCDGWFGALLTLPRDLQAESRRAPRVNSLTLAQVPARPA